MMETTEIANATESMNAGGWESEGGEKTAQIHIQWSFWLGKDTFKKKMIHST